MSKKTIAITFGWLGLFLLIGLLLRSYNLDFPAIGYHNMKENDYLSIAQEMERTHDYISRKIYFWNAFEENPEMKVYPQVPLISYQILASWRMLDKNIWGPRLINVIFGIAGILVVYRIAALLFANNALALYSAFLLAIMPLAVFFSRNLQPESPAFFFMLLGNLFYLKFIKAFRKRNLVFGGLFFSIAWIYKISFIFGALPLVFCVPFKELIRRKKELIKYAAAFLAPYLIILATILWLKYIGQWEFQDIARVSIWEIFSADYWKKNGRAIYWYVVGENFTPVFTVTAILGVALAFIKRKGLLNRYLIGWILAAVVYGMFFSDYINQHSYYQMPFLLLVCVASAYIISSFSNLLKKISRKNLLVLFMIIITGVSSPFVYGAIQRMYAVVFLGVDVAGESLKEFTKTDERIFLYTYPQGYAIARYGRRYVGWIADLEEFKQKEKKFNIKYVCFYPIEYALLLKANNLPLFEYIQGNYHVKEAGFTKEPEKLYYVILERGKGSDPETFLKSFSGAMQLRTVYKIFGGYIFFYVIRPEVGEKEIKTHADQR